MAVNVNHVHQFQKRKIFAIGIKCFAIRSEIEYPRCVCCYQFIKYFLLKSKLRSNCIGATTIEMAKNNRLIVRDPFCGEIEPNAINLCVSGNKFKNHVINKDLPIYDVQCL
jgi:hypothetical protein